MALHQNEFQEVCVIWGEHCDAQVITLFNYIWEELRFQVLSSGSNMAKYVSCNLRLMPLNV